MQPDGKRPAIDLRPLDPATLVIGQTVHARAYLIDEPDRFPRLPADVDRLLHEFSTSEVVCELPIRDKTPVYATREAALLAGIEFERAYAIELLSACERAEAGLARQLAGQQQQPSGAGAGEGQTATSGD